MTTAATAALSPEPFDGPGLGATADDTEIITWADFKAWERQLDTTGTCSHPIRLTGRIEAIDRTTGEVAPVYDTAAEPGGVLHVACGNRRETVCNAPTNTGTTKRVYVYGRTHAEAREKLIAEQAKVMAGIPVPAQSWKLGAYLDYWLKHVVKPTRRPATVALYEINIRVHLKPGLGKHQLRRLSVPILQAFLNGKIKSGQSVRNVQILRPSDTATLVNFGGQDPDSAYSGGRLSWWAQLGSNQ